jgi:hypothetical protein
MESPEREELGGALPAFDGQAPPHPPQEVSDASARPQTRVCGVSPFSRPALPPRRLFAEAPVLPNAGALKFMRHLLQCLEGTKSNDGPAVAALDAGQKGKGTGPSQ